MPWRPLPEPDDLPDDLNAKVRILVDENLGVEVARYLKEKGYNVVFAGDVGLAGKGDEDIAAYAWREGRMIWTQDNDFLKDEVVPEQSNPGVVVLPGGSGDDNALGMGLFVGMTVFGHGPESWKKTKTTISPTGEMTIRRRDINSGKVTKSRYRLARNKMPEEWLDE